ncbi:hypothetical protein [Gracilimonas halophila]|uniref:Uncharacterized protein n=1 Tax=Gracilimonas halophila TaxID=1834464 RepID=A0ABW5JKD4_9BACT
MNSILVLSDCFLTGMEGLLNIEYGSESNTPVTTSHAFPYTSEAVQGFAGFGQPGSRQLGG